MEHTIAGRSVTQDTASGVAYVSFRTRKARIAPNHRSALGGPLLIRLTRQDRAAREISTWFFTANLMAAGLESGVKPR